MVDEVHLVRWALEKLPPDFRAALVLREYGGLTYQEIADTQDIPIDTVKSRIARARQGMAALLLAG
jgi:RNA polymerase sigma-70 factor (ECF subfamily)